MMRTCFPPIHFPLQQTSSSVAAGKHGSMVSMKAVGHKERKASNNNAHKSTEKDESQGQEIHVVADLQSAGENVIGSDLQLSAFKEPNHDNIWSKTDSFNKNAGSIDNAALLGGDMPPSIEPNVATIDRHRDKVFALAVAGNLLYTASESKDIRVFRAPYFEEVDCFGSGNGMVQSLLAFGNRLYSAHQDNRIRVWRRIIYRTRANINLYMKHKLVTVLPRLDHFVKSMLLDRHYVQVRRHKRKLWIEHADTISALALGSSCSTSANGNDAGPPPTVLYSASWDKTIKVWSLSNFKCIESFYAHKDAINAMIVIDGIMLATASADGSIKLWTRLVHGSSRRKKHSLVNTLEGHKAAVNALAISANGKILYSGGSDGVIIAWKKVHSKPTAGLCGQSTIGSTLSDQGLLQSSITSSNTASRYDSDAADQCSSVINPNQGNVYLAKLGSSSSGEMISENFIGVVPKQNHKVGLLARLSRAGAIGSINFAIRKVIIGHARAVLSVTAVRDDIVCSSSADKTIRVWKRITQCPDHSTKHQKLYELDRNLASAAERSASAWEYECLAVLGGHSGPVKAIASVLCPKENKQQKYGDNSKGMVIFSAGLDSKVKVWVMPQA